MVHWVYAILKFSLSKGGRGANHSTYVVLQILWDAVFDICGRDMQQEMTKKKMPVFFSRSPEN